MNDTTFTPSQAFPTEKDLQKYKDNMQSLIGAALQPQTTKIRRPKFDKLPDFHPWQVERHDQDDGSISYEIWCNHPDCYGRITTINDRYDNEQAKLLAARIVTLHNEALNA